MLTYTVICEAKTWGWIEKWAAPYFIIRDNFSIENGGKGRFFTPKNLLSKIAQHVKIIRSYNIYSIVTAPSLELYI
jgi:hypothetical protein